MSEPVPIVLVVDGERFFREAICDALREAGVASRAAGRWRRWRPRAIRPSA
jgi:hypothetical protein